VRLNVHPAVVGQYQSAYHKGLMGNPDSCPNGFDRNLWRQGYDAGKAEGRHRLAERDLRFREGVAASAITKYEDWLRRLDKERARVVALLALPQPQYVVREQIFKMTCKEALYEIDEEIANIKANLQFQQKKF
jgi:hypothetical protein